MNDHVAVLRKFRETGGVTTFKELDAALDHAIAAIEERDKLVARLGELSARWRKATDENGDEYGDDLTEYDGDDMTELATEHADAIDRVVKEVGG